MFLWTPLGALRCLWRSDHILHVIRTHGLTHIALKVSDVGRSLEFYGNVFGFVETHRGETFVQAQIPGTRDIIVLESRGNPKSPGKSGGNAHFGFRLTSAGDIKAAIDTIARAGGKIMKSGEFALGEPYVFFRDPDGHGVEVWYELPTKLDPSEPGSGKTKDSECELKVWP